MGQRATLFKMFEAGTSSLQRDQELARYQDEVRKVKEDLERALSISMSFKMRRII